MNHEAGTEVAAAGGIASRPSAESLLLAAKILAARRQANRQAGTSMQPPSIAGLDLNASEGRVTRGGQSIIEEAGTGLTAPRHRTHLHTPPRAVENHIVSCICRLSRRKCDLRPCAYSGDPPAATSCLPRRPCRAAGSRHRPAALPQKRQSRSSRRRRPWSLCSQAREPWTQLVLIITVVLALDGLCARCLFTRLNVYTRFCDHLVHAKLGTR